MGKSICATEDKRKATCYGFAWQEMAYCQS